LISYGSLTHCSLFSQQDAWFETAKVDESLQLKKLKAMEKTKDQGEDTELTKEEIWVIQKRIAAALLPEETVRLAS
jgi:hypothetical protein